MVIQQTLFGMEVGIFKGLHLFEQDPALMEQADALIQSWRKAYPSVSVESEIAKAHAWELVPGNRKRNQIRFLNNWMRKASSAPPAPMSVADIANSIRMAMD